MFLVHTYIFSDSQNYGVTNLSKYTLEQFENNKKLF